MPHNSNPTLSGSSQHISCSRPLNSTMQYTPKYPLLRFVPGQTIEEYDDN